MKLKQIYSYHECTGYEIEGANLYPLEDFIKEVDSIEGLNLRKNYKIEYSIKGYLSAFEYTTFSFEVSELGAFHIKNRHVGDNSYYAHLLAFILAHNEKIGKAIYKDVFGNPEIEITFEGTLRMIEYREREEKQKLLEYESDIKYSKLPIKTHAELAESFKRDFTQNNKLAWLRATYPKGLIILGEE